MTRSLASVIAIALLALSSFSQNSSGPKLAPAVQPAIPAVTNAPLDLAKATLVAHGGDKLKSMRSVIMKGSVDVNVMGQAISGVFSTALSGDKYFFEINVVVQQMKQIYDGRQTYSSVAPFSLPPITTVGFFVISRIGDAGYVISPLPEKLKKRNGFRITSPEGFYTDFFVDEKTGQVKGYESAFELNSGQVVTTSADFDEFQTLEGVVLPKKYAQRFDLGPSTAYATFKTKQVSVNSTIEDAAFAIPK